MYAVSTRESDPSVRSQVSDAEWAQRCDLAAGYRLFAHHGVEDLTYNHISARVPDEPDAMLIKPLDMMFSEITASSLLKFKLDGTPLLGQAQAARGALLVIHGSFLERRPDLNVIAHTHTVANMAVGMMKCGLMPVSQHAIMFHNRIRYHLFKGFEFDLSMKDDLAESLGEDGRIALLRNHGALVAGETMAEVFVSHHFLEMACRTQVAALSSGQEIILPEADVCDRGVEQLASVDAFSGKKDWGALRRQADRLFPDYRT